MKKNILIFLVLIIFFSCKNNKTDSNKLAQNSEAKITSEIIDEIGKIFTEKVFELNKDGERIVTPVFYIEGRNLFHGNKDGTKGALYLKIDGDKVFEYGKDGEQKKQVFFFEGAKYWEVDKKTQQKGNLIFERRGSDIFHNTKNGMKKAFVIE